MPKKTEYAQGTPDWVDLQTTDQAAAKNFYGSLFGWSYDDRPMGPDAVYSMATLNGETVAAIAPMPPGVPDGMPPMWNTYIAVDDVDAAVAKVQPAGGQPITVQATMTAGSIYSLLVLQTDDGRVTAAVLADARREGPVPQGGVNTGAGGSARDTRAGPILALIGGLLLVAFGGLAASRARRLPIRWR